MKCLYFRRNISQDSNQLNSSFEFKSHEATCETINRLNRAVWWFAMHIYIYVLKLWITTDSVLKASCVINWMASLSHYEQLSNTDVLSTQYQQHLPTSCLLIFFCSGRVAHALIVLEAILQPLYTAYLKYFQINPFSDSSDSAVSTALIINVIHWLLATLA